MPRFFSIESNVSVRIWEQEVDALEQVGRPFRLYWSCPVEVARNNDGFLYLRYNEARAESGYVAQQFKNVFHGIKLVLPEGDTPSSSDNSSDPNDDGDSSPDGFQTASEFAPLSEADTIILPASAGDAEGDGLHSSTPRGHAVAIYSTEMPNHDSATPGTPGNNGVEIKSEANTPTASLGNSTCQTSTMDASTQHEPPTTPEGNRTEAAGAEDSHSPSLLASRTSRILRSHTKKLQEKK